MDHLSNRGRELVESPPLAEYISAHFERAAHSWEPGESSDGYIALCIAENKQVLDLLAPRLERVGGVPGRALGYDAMIGAQPFREQLAAFMSRAFLGRDTTAEQLAVVAGAGTVLELLFYAICDPGDAVLVPTPSYAGFWADLETRDALTIVPVHRNSADGFRLTPEALEEAMHRAGRPVRALLLTTPDNPLGRVYDAQQLEAIWRWAEAHDLHVVFDEVYALSIFGDRPFVSAASLRPTLGSRAHVVWAFSKDFGASGLRCGVLLSDNPDVLRAVDGLAYWGACSGHTQFLLGEVISDTAWVDHFIDQMRSRLGASYRQVTGALTQHGIEFVPADAGFFVVCDLRPFLSEPTWDAEAHLWRRILDEANVNLTPGSACHAGEPGFFRLCYAGVPPEAVTTALDRIGRLLG